MPYDEFLGYGGLPWFNLERAKVQPQTEGGIRCAY